MSDGESAVGDGGDVHVDQIMIQRKQQQHDKQDQANPLQSQINLEEIHETIYDPITKVYDKNKFKDKFNGDSFSSDHDFKKDLEVSAMVPQEQNLGESMKQKISSFCDLHFQIFDNDTEESKKNTVQMIQECNNIKKTQKDIVHNHLTNVLEQKQYLNHAAADEYIAKLSSVFKTVYADSKFEQSFLILSSFAKDYQSQTSDFRANMDKTLVRILQLFDWVFDHPVIIESFVNMMENSLYFSIFVNIPHSHALHKDFIRNLRLLIGYASLKQVWRNEELTPLFNDMLYQVYTGYIKAWKFYYDKKHYQTNKLPQLRYKNVYAQNLNVKLMLTSSGQSKQLQRMTQSFRRLHFPAPADNDGSILKKFKLMLCDKYGLSYIDTAIKYFFIPQRIASMSIANIIKSSSYNRQAHCMFVHTVIFMKEFLERLMIYPPVTTATTEYLKKFNSSWRSNWTELRKAPSVVTWFHGKHVCQDQIYHIFSLYKEKHFNYSELYHWIKKTIIKEQKLWISPFKQDCKFAICAYETNAEFKLTENGKKELTDQFNKHCDDLKRTMQDLDVVYDTDVNNADALKANFSKISSVFSKYDTEESINRGLSSVKAIIKDSQSNPSLDDYELAHSRQELMFGVNVRDSVMTGDVLEGDDLDGLEGNDLAGSDDLDELDMDQNYNKPKQIRKSKISKKKKFKKTHIS